MTPKGGTCFFLLFMACAALAKPPDRMPGNKADIKYIAKKLMTKCRNKGYPVPKLMLLKTVFSNSDLPEEDRDLDQADPIQSLFLQVQKSFIVGTNKDSPLQHVQDDSEKRPNKMCKCRYLAAVIKRMRNSSEPSTCYLKAFVAALAWKTVTTRCENNTDSKDYDTLLWTAKPVLQDIPSERMSLPTKVPGQNVKKMMNMLQTVYDDMSDDERTVVVQWAKEQITQINFNCTMSQPSDSKSMLMERCKPSLKWLNAETLDMMRRYLPHLTPEDVHSSPKEQLCEFFRVGWFDSTTRRTPAKMNPSLSKKFLQRLKECFSGKEIEEHGDKLGPLACYYQNPDLSPEFSRKLLPQLDDCDNPTNLKKCLINSVMSNSSSALALQNLGSSARFLSPKQLSDIPVPILSKVLKKLGAGIQWKKSQLPILLQKQLGDKKCNEVSVKKLMVFPSIVEGLPSCAFKNIKEEILSDTEALKIISNRMTNVKLKVILQQLLVNGNLTKLVQKLPGPLLSSISLNSLDKANIASLDQVKDKPWSRPQAALLLKTMSVRNQLPYRDRRLCSVFQGISSSMIDELNDTDVRDMVQTLSETPQCSLGLSKRQAGYIAMRFWVSLEKERADYFKTITEQELDNIPPFLLLHLRPRMVMDLPDSVCHVLLDKMKEANLSSLPPRSPSRYALTQRALLCLTNGGNLSGLAAQDVYRLGPFRCELQPRQLRQMAPDVFNPSLQAMASCQDIPQHHRADLLQLIKQTFGIPSKWTAETMEKLGSLLLLDDDATSALPNKPWMKDVLYFLKSRQSRDSDALKKKLFELTTTNRSNPTCENGAANSTSIGSRNRTGDSNNNINTDSTGEELTEAMIVQLGKLNVYWTWAQLELISEDTFLATVEILGEIGGYNADQLGVLSEKAIKAFGPVSQMTDNVVMQLGCIAQGFPDSDLEKLPFSLDALEEIAHCGWNDSQMELVWKSVAKYNNLTAQQLGVVEMVALNRFICGLNSSEIRQLNIDAFKDAVGLLGGIQCPFKVVHQFTRLAVSAFGQPRTWTGALVSDLCTFNAGLNETELASLNPSALSFVGGTCILLIPPHIFAELSPAQLEALEPDTAAMVTPEQQAMLGDDQLAALETAVTGSYERSRNSDKSGAPSLSVEGISSLMKPLLFLLMGFVLL